MFRVACQVPDGFADDFQVADNRIDCLRIRLDCSKVSPSTYRSILAIAARMSSTRSRHSLGGNHRLAKNSVA
jgi:hypothetical protein